MSRIWDISQPLHAAVPVWPGEPAFALHSHAMIGDGCPVNVGGMFTPLPRVVSWNCQIEWCPYVWPKAPLKRSH